MNSLRLRLTFAFVALLSLPTAGLTAAEGDEHTPLGEQMEVIGDAFRQLRRQAEDPEQNTSTLELLATMRAAAEKALELKPEYTADQPEDEQAKFVEAFRQDMHAFIGLIDEATAAIKAGDNTKAAGLVDQMRDAQRSSHKAYRRPKD